MIEGLRRNGVEVVECHQKLWRGIDDRVQVASGRWLSFKFVARVVRTYYRLLQGYRQIGDYDVMVLGYPGQLDVYLARVLTWLRRKPLVLDVFMSIYLIASERELTSKHPITARLIYWVEKLALHLPDLLIQDTAEYVAWLQKTYGLNPARFRLVPTGADDRVFCPFEASKRDDGLFHVLYYGTFIPNHGVEHIVEAARILRDETDIHFELVGDGPDKAQSETLIEEYGLTNIVLADWVDKQSLPRKIAEADVCLGVFGATPQSMMTVQNKIYETLAMAKPLITGESTTVRTVLKDGEHLLLCRRQDPFSLAEMILHLKTRPNLQARLAKQGRERYVSEFTTTALGQRFSTHLDALIKRLG